MLHQWLPCEDIFPTTRRLSQGHLQPIGILREVKGRHLRGDLQGSENLPHIHVASDCKEESWLQHEVGLVQDLDILLHHKHTPTLVQSNVVLLTSPSFRFFVFNDNGVIGVVRSTFIYMK